MTVRANKPAFNIREKLKELTQNIGLKGRELMRAATVQEARDLVSAGRKNMVINGDMRISQRYGTTSTNTGSGTFVIDRHRHENNNSGSTTAQQVTDAPVGFHNSMKITVTGTDTSIVSNEFSYVRHIIEGNNINHLNWGTSNAKTVTLSFWVKSSVTGDFGGSLWNDAFNRSFPFNYTINFANSWEHKSITVPGCPDGTWESGIARGINIGFIFLSGSTYTGPPGQWNSAGDIGPTNMVNLLATNGATWYITGIQLEVGKNATDFEHRSYGEELALCQRYYYHHADASAKPVCNGAAYQSNRAFGVVHLPVTMRTAPSVIATSGPSNFRFFANGTSTGFSTLTLQENFITAVTVETSNTLSVTAGHAGWIRTDAGALAFNAEL